MNESKTALPARDVSPTAGVETTVAVIGGSGLNSFDGYCPVPVIGADCCLAVDREGRRSGSRASPRVAIPGLLEGLEQRSYAGPTGIDDLVGRE